ncbi:acyl-ACP--UDP-N-acetylglucosamine O-acyltransferase [Oceanicella sp. SM1341]|uniref:acyl-ACP--UDP-N-acetylglucosamine O-acyltransferase n=1 Tax=Oceanicella sp. SM1341 TaxID=1548889 RepID=UPI000E4A869C|nr:acyl-ACP--UDP-N-acetylglucosamine O-acyltransferase [Oceanicella sp. SM1341]
MSIHPEARIHPSSVIEDGATIGAGCVIGPFCTVGADVRLAERVELVSHVAVAGHTEVGTETRIWPFASIGHQPQDLKYRGEATRLVIGARNMIREHVTMNPGTAGGGGVTRIGDGGLFMMSAHIGHDCMVGDGVVLANNATLGGHVQMGDNVVMGGLSAVHQWCRIGRGAMIGGVCGVVHDVIPHGLVVGDRARLQGLNLVGLKRRGVPRDELHALRAAYKELFEGEGPLAERARAVSERWPENPLVAEIAGFILADSSRSFCTP